MGRGGRITNIIVYSPLLLSILQHQHDCAFSPVAQHVINLRGLLGGDALELSYLVRSWHIPTSVPKGTSSQDRHTEAGAFGLTLFVAARLNNI